LSSDVVEMEVKLIERYLARREGIVSEAQKKAEEIAGAATERAKKLVLEGQEDQRRITGTDVRAIRDRILGEAEQEGRRKLMEAREELIRRLFNELRNRLQAVADGTYEGVGYYPILLRLVRQAASAIGENQMVVALNRRDRQHVTRNLSDFQKEIQQLLNSEIEVLVDDEPIDCIGGAVVFDASKRKIYYNTFDSRIETARNTLAPEVARSLGVV